MKVTLNKSFDRLRTNGTLLIPFVVSLSNHERSPLVQCFLKSHQRVMRLLAVAAPLLLASCVMGPDYRRPQVVSPPQYKESKDWKTAEPRDGVPRGKWWEIFGDPQLNALADKVGTSNQNLRAAEAQYRRAQALVQSSRSGLWPSVGAALDVTRSGSGTRGAATTYDIAANASWDADLWGRVRRSVESSEAAAQASAAEVESVRLLVQSELVLDYLLLRVLDAQKILLDENVAALFKTLELTRNRYKAGVVGRVDVAQAETQLNSTRAQSIDTGVQRAQLEHAIAVLLGAAPAEFALPAGPIKVTMPSIPTGLPSELLERRPDIAAAERRVAAANAQIGVAKAAYYPSLTLSGNVGYQNASFARWLTAPSRFWSLGPELALSIFDGGLRKSLTDQAIASYDASVATYRQTVLTAFQDVEDNLAVLRILEQEAKVQDEAIAAARLSMELTLNQYKAGTVSYINVAIVQAALLNNERTAMVLLGRRLAAATLLVRALGGGWTVEGRVAAK
jgi:NodT family efflux transporter outer membrane factor (OMF) lipoprotein